MHPFRTRRPEAFRRLQSAVSYLLGGGKLALIQPHTGPVFDIDRGKNQQNKIPLYGCSAFKVCLFQCALG